MSRFEPIPIVRCHLGPGEDPAHTLRYVRLGEFELWRYMMENRHRREVSIEDVSLWIPDGAALLMAEISDPELCDAVVRIRFEIPGVHAIPVPVERFLPAQTYPEAHAALLSHFPGASLGMIAIAGYFVPAAARAEVVY